MGRGRPSVAQTGATNGNEGRGSAETSGARLAPTQQEGVDLFAEKNRETGLLK